MNEEGSTVPNPLSFFIAIVQSPAMFFFEIFCCFPCGFIFRCKSFPGGRICLFVGLLVQEVPTFVGSSVSVLSSWSSNVQTFRRKSLQSRLLDLDGKIAQMRFLGGKEEPSAMPIRYCSHILLYETFQDRGRGAFACCLFFSHLFHALVSEEMRAFREMQSK